MHGNATVHYYFDRGFDIEAARIMPGGFLASRTDMMITTVLGSCVAACLWDSNARVGGMNHFMLPESAEPCTGDQMSARYGVHAMEMLINEMLKLGARKRDFCAKVFGGGRVLDAVNAIDVGRRNAEFVLEFLAGEGIRIVASDLLDVHPRKVNFFPTSGRALVKHLKDAQRAALLDNEHTYRRAVAREDQRAAGSVELF